MTKHNDAFDSFAYAYNTYLKLKGEINMIHGQGELEKQGTGGNRESRKGRGRFDLITYEAAEALAIWCEQGSEKYGDRNWENGLSVKDSISRMVGHAIKAANGWTDEDHLAAVMWNAMCAITMEKRKYMDEFRDHPWKGPHGEPIVHDDPMNGGSLCAVPRCIHDDTDCLDCNEYKPNAVVCTYSMSHPDKIPPECTNNICRAQCHNCCFVKLFDDTKVKEETYVEPTKYQKVKIFNGEDWIELHGVKGKDGKEDLTEKIDGTDMYCSYEEENGISPTCDRFKHTKFCRRDGFQCEFYKEIATVKVEEVWWDPDTQEIYHVMSNGTITKAKPEMGEFKEFGDVNDQWLEFREGLIKR